ncbi:MAG TPA: glycerol-3-phosphate acyltransferase [Melioribacteraceae bacterium]|nr:glycerol-3-phosphate acyltransferase [Melioribacteraceae bacterium]
MNFLLSALLGYCFGSIPTAYIIVKLLHNKNIITNGSGNVGALNSYEVTNSKFTGFLILIIDFLKGLIPILLIKIFFEEDFYLLINASLFAVIGHCFSVFLLFKGGRGLSTAAGSLIFIAPPIFVIWVIIWVISYIYKRHIHFANGAATLLTAVFSFTASKFFIKFTYPIAYDKLAFSLYISSIMLIILIKHYYPLKEYFYPTKKSEVENEQV